jgi:hypothetical protein
MPIDFTCKCGKHLRAKDDQAGKRIQCPACGRALVAPELPAAAGAPSEWRIDRAPEVAARAEQAGVVRQGRASVVQLHSDGGLHRDLKVEGNVSCWHCRSEMPFVGHVFGRVGLGGTMLAVNCSRCHARVWLGYSSHEVGGGTDIYLYAPSKTRDYAFSDDEALPAPTLRVERVGEHVNPPQAEKDWISTLLPSFVQGVGRKEAYQEVGALAGKLASQPMTASLLEGVCRPVRALLEREQNTYLMAILAETLAALRDEEAAPLVQDALRRALAKEDPSDQTNLPLHDLCVLALLFGDGNDFLEAMSGGLKKLTIPTRACKLGKQLTPKEILPLLEDSGHLDCYESALPGTSWQQIHPLLPLSVDPDVLARETGPKGGWLNRLFNPTSGRKDKKRV